MDKIREEFEKTVYGKDPAPGDYNNFEAGYKSANLLPTEKVCPECGGSREIILADRSYYPPQEDFCECEDCKNGTIPLYYTPEQYEKIMGNPYPDDTMVWMQIDNKKKWVTFRYDTAKDMYNDLPCYIIQTAQPAPPADYRPDHV